ncbi:hypothetical protein ACE10Z_09925 [Bradyrhizobium sp. Pha-3]|uniref:hypothetical protein n=1 Tax=Bradyrhizobium sp. Pha-3 TaxID=208375 RepID=UPI0035D40723
MQISRKEETEDYVRHECGHWLLAKILGFPTEEIRLQEEKAYSALKVFPVIKDLGDMREFIERRVIVLYGGAIAQSMRGRKMMNEITHEFIRTTASDDKSKLDQLIRMHAATAWDGSDKDHYEKVSSEIESRLYNEAASLLENNADVLHGLTKHFMKLYKKAGKPKDFQCSNEELGQFEPLQTLTLGRLPADDVPTKE